MSTQGLEGVPFTKGVLYLTTGASILSQALQASHRSTPALLLSASKLVVFQSPGELVFGCFLLYYFRVLERQAGTSKFAAFAAMVTGLSSVLQVLLFKGLKLDSPSASGPYGMIFACLVQFFLNIPPSSKFNFIGFKLSDKTFCYLGGLQLLLIGGKSTIVAGIAGMVAGCLYKVNFLGIKKLRFPAFVTRFFSSTLGPLLRESQQPQDAASRGSRSQGAGGRSQQQQQQQAHAGSQPRQRAQQQQQQHQPQPGPALSEEALQRLMEMGFEQGQAALALQAVGNDVDQAISLLVG